MKKFVLAFLCIMILLTGCDKQEENVNPNFGGTISLFAYSPDTLNPLETVYKTNASTLSALIYKPLLTLNDDFSVSPALAESWSFSPDGGTLTLKLRTDVNFSDGTPLNASHAKLSFDILKENPDNMYYSVTEFADSCSANGNTITFSLKKSGTGILKHLNFPILKDSDSLLGCGPYTVSSSDKNGLVLTAVTNELAPFKPNIEKVNVKFYPKEEMWANSFLTSEIDVIPADMSVLSKLTAKTNVTATDYVTDTFTYLGFNAESTILPDANARRAVGYLIDKEKMAEEIFVGYVKNASSPFKPDTEFYGLYQDDFEFNKELAKQCMEESEAESFTFNILINEESDSKKKTAEYIASKLNEGGMQVTISALPFDEYLKNIEEGNYTAYIGEINVSPDQDFKFLFHSSGNNLRLNDPETDIALEGFCTSTDETKKAEYAKNVQKQLFEKAPIISLYYQTNVFVVNDKIKGEFSPLPNNLYNGIESWIAK